FQAEPQVELAFHRALLGRAREPLARLALLLGTYGAPEQKAAQVHLRVGTILLGRGAIPALGLRQVARQAATTLLVEQRQGELRLGVPHFGRFAEQGQRFRVIARHAFAFAVAIGQVVHGFGVAVPRRTLIPPRRLLSAAARATALRNRARVVLGHSRGTPRRLRDQLLCRRAIGLSQDTHHFHQGEGRLRRRKPGVSRSTQPPCRLAEVLPR